MGRFSIRSQRPSMRPTENYRARFPKPSLSHQMDDDARESADWPGRDAGRRRSSVSADRRLRVLSAGALYLLAEQGEPMMKIALLEELARDQVYQFAFFGAPLRLRGATGPPPPPWAMPLRGQAA
jgi:hypothetical protein